MFNKNYLFIFISILLAFIISCFYSKNMDLNFLMIFIVLSLFFYIVFYYLGSTRESYTDYKKSYTHNYHSYDNLNNHILRDHLEESEHVEEEINHKKYKNNTLKKHLENQQVEEEIHQKEYKHNSLKKHLENQQVEEEIHQKEYKHNSLKKHLENQQVEEEIHQQQIEEEIHNYHPTQMQEEEVNTIPHNEIVKPDINKILLENPISKTTSPLNINISYNSQNSINELDNNDKDYKPYKPYKDNNDNKNKSKNLGSYCENSRVYNNSDWIYGSNAWSNDPDYYIPSKGCSNKYDKDNNCITEVPQPLNELINTRKYKENKNVCPLMINTPWTEYKTGDSEPEPYNL